jgi:hypothetical protein
MATSRMARDRACHPWATNATSRRATYDPDNLAEGDRVAADDLRPGVLAAYAIPIINPDIPSRLERACEVIVWAT